MSEWKSVKQPPDTGRFVVIWIKGFSRDNPDGWTKEPGGFDSLGWYIISSQTGYEEVEMNGDELWHEFPENPQ